MTTGVTRIELLEDEAKLFITFRQFQVPFAEMAMAGVFQIQNGSAELHFADSKLQKIFVHTLAYKRGNGII